ncbi:hypothetical protein K469DRAFT_100111 [Zopfia rhizophila CBS 207.26]|uniref:Secreted protein n=1 Tax=Zopfia rhizophila CBS 207.26 TaxID=1314779 RepID=A0A6A6E7V8_9PEZI|nr:hypothetical protein K469DRAFT_100111 [Zopfia rhizophila CBS 207.26]
MAAMQRCGPSGLALLVVTTSCAPSPLDITHKHCLHSLRHSTFALTPYPTGGYTRAHRGPPGGVARMWA